MLLVNSSVRSIPFVNGTSNLLAKPKVAWAVLEHMTLGSSCIKCLRF